MLQLLRTFPAEVEWLVAFRLAAILPDAGGVPAEAIFLLEPGRLRPDDAYVVLTSRGRYLVDETRVPRPSVWPRPTQSAKPKGAAQSRWPSPSRRPRVPPRW
jgi:hypothetical protein